MIAKDSDGSIGGLKSQGLGPRSEFGGGKSLSCINFRQRCHGSSHLVSVLGRPRGGGRAEKLVVFLRLAAYRFQGAPFY